jgi:hypothetical protein
MSIINSYNWFSNPTQFNDPFDCQISLQKGEISVDEYMKHYVLALHGEAIKDSKPYKVMFPEDAIINHTFTDSFHDLLVNFGNHVENVVKEVAVLSLSENFNNTTMWSHYAENHQGICIEYAPEMMNKNQDLKDFCFNVEYLPSKEISFNVYELYAKCSNNRNHEQFSKLMRDLALTKSDDWKYEKEWRLISTKRGIIRYDDRAIKGIYFGLKCGVEEKLTIRNILGNKPIYFFQMVKSSDGLSIDRHAMDKNSDYWSTSPV